MSVKEKMALGAAKNYTDLVTEALPSNKILNSLVNCLDFYMAGSTPDTFVKTGNSIEYVNTSATIGLLVMLVDLTGVNYEKINISFEHLNTIYSTLSLHTISNINKGNFATLAYSATYAEQSVLLTKSQLIDLALDTGFLIKITKSSAWNLKLQNFRVNTEKTMLMPTNLNDMVAYLDENISNNEIGLRDVDGIFPSKVYTVSDVVAINENNSITLYVDHFASLASYKKLRFSKTKTDKYRLFSDVGTAQTNNVVQTNRTINVDGFSVSSFITNQISTKSDITLDSNIRVLPIGDSVGGGFGGTQNVINDNPRTSWAIAQKLFYLDSIKSGDVTKHKIQFLGFRNVVDVSATYNSTTKTGKAYSEGRGGWKLSDYLYLENVAEVYNPFYDATKTWTNAALNTAGVKFSLAKYLARFRTHDDSGNQLAVGYGINIKTSGLTDTDTMSININDAYVNTPTHIIIQLGLNDTHDANYIINISYIIDAIKEEYPSMIVGLSLTDSVGSYFPELYTEYAFDNFSYLLGDTTLHPKCYEWNNLLQGLENVVNKIFYIPNYFIQPTAEGVATKTITSNDGTVINADDSTYGKYHPNNVAHSAWGYELYAWLKYTLSL